MEKLINNNAQNRALSFISADEGIIIIVYKYVDNNMYLQ